MASPDSRLILKPNDLGNTWPNNIGKSTPANFFKTL